MFQLILCLVTNKTMTGFVFLSVLTQNKARYQFILGEKPLLVHIFSSDFHFNPYILFLPFLAPILKNASCFSPCHYIRNGETMTGFVFLSVLTQNKARYQFILGKKSLLVPTFSSDFHFNLYILFLLFLVPILKNISCFSPYRYIRNGES